MNEQIKQMLWCMTYAAMAGAGLKPIVCSERANLAVLQFADRFDDDKPTDE